MASSPSQKAYRRMAVKWHPDKFPHDHEVAQKRFIKISQAYTTLSNPEKRILYDQLGEAAFDNQESTPPQTHQMFNVFMNHPFLNNIFAGIPLSMAFASHQDGANGGAASQINLPNDFCGEDIFRARMQQKDPPLMQDLVIPLSDFYYGADKQLKITRKDKTNPNNVQELFNTVVVKFDLVFLKIPKSRLKTWAIFIQVENLRT